MAIAGFSTEQQDVLAKLHNTKKAELSDALCLLQQKDPTYQDLAWRFEIQVSILQQSIVLYLFFIVHIENTSTKKIQGSVMYKRHA